MIVLQIFQNYYVYSISISQFTSSQEVFLLENKQLMKSPYCEIGGQQTFTVTVSDLVKGGFSHDVLTTLRVYIYQPSPQWAKFELKQIRALGKSISSPPVDGSLTDPTRINLMSLITLDLRSLLAKSQTKMHSSDMGFQSIYANDSIGKKLRLDKRKHRKDDGI